MSLPTCAKGLWRKNNVMAISSPSSDLKDRFAGLLLGTAVGDALGLPAEGMSRNKGLTSPFMDGLLQESVRDSNHPALAFAAMVNAAETARQQGLIFTPRKANASWPQWNFRLNIYRRTAPSRRGTGRPASTTIWLGKL